MVTFKLNRDGSKQWFVKFDGVLYKCVNQDVANELGRLFQQRAVKVTAKVAVKKTHKNFWLCMGD